MCGKAPLTAVVALTVCLGGPVRAQAPSGPPPPDQAAAQAVRAEVERLRQEFDAVKQQYGDRLAALESRLAALEAGRAQAQAAPAAPAAPTAPAPAVPSAPAVQPEPPQPAAPQAAAAAPPQAPEQAANPAQAGAPAAPGQGVPVPSGAAGAGGPEGSLPVYGNASALSKVFNPDIAVIGNFLGAAGTNHVAPSPAFQMQEAEVSYQAIVDPYARADFFIGIGGDGTIDIEEGYLTLTSLPGGLLTKVGKMYQAYGKVNQMHSHILPWTDRPLMNVNLVGGGEPVNDAGISVSRLIPNPWLFMEATGEVYRGESSLFKAPTASDLSYAAHLRAYQDIGEASNVDFGTSFAYGHNDAVSANGTTRLVGIDATFRYRPLRRAIYKRFLARTEMTWSRRSELGPVPQSFGTYVSGEYQFARRWFGGVRFDYSDRATDAHVSDKGGSLVLTYWPSEFSQIRGQYRRTRYGDQAGSANEFLFQFLFSIGAHGAHPF